MNRKIFFSVVAVMFLMVTVFSGMAFAFLEKAVTTSNGSAKVPVTRIGLMTTVVKSSPHFHVKNPVKTRPWVR